MESEKEKTKAVDDAFFLERLEAFMQRNLFEIGAFAHREGRSSDEIRRRVAEWHCKFLFDTNRVSTRPCSESTADVVGDQVHDILQATSQTLESLHNIAGRHSLLLVVDPTDGADDGFLGGTLTGREFWRGLRGGGSSGAKNFKDKCKVATARTVIPGTSSLSTQDLSDSGTKRTPALAMKYDLYTAMRTALRSVSGIRNSEMKWKKPENLEIYGVRLVGWPASIDFKNPSQMTLRETTTLMNLLQTNALYFQRINSLDEQRLPESSSAFAGTALLDHRSNIEGETDLSWACNDDVLSAETSGVTITANASDPIASGTPFGAQPISHLLGCSALQSPGVISSDAQHMSVSLSKTFPPISRHSEATSVPLAILTDSGNPHATDGSSNSQHTPQRRKRLREASNVS